MDLKQSPILDTPIPSFPTPDMADVVLAEFHDTRPAHYVTLAYGTAHPDATRYPAHVLTFQGPVDTAGNYVRRIYVSNRSDEDAYNYVITYSQDHPEYPIYARSYIVRREAYADLAIGTADPGLEPGPNTGVLVAQRCLESTGTEEIDSLYVKVVRLYERLPGPWLPSPRYDPLLGAIAGRRRAVLTAAGQVAALTATTRTSYEPREGSAVVSWQLQETNSDGSGSANNPVYPRTVSNAHEAARGDVETTEQVSTDLSTDSSLVIGGRLASGPLTSATAVGLRAVTLLDRGTGMVPDGGTNLVLSGGTFSSPGQALVLTTRVVSVALVEDGDGFAPTGTAHSVTMTGTTGYGSRVTLAVPVGANGAIFGTPTIASPGSYTDNPEDLAAEPLDAAGLLGEPPTVRIEMGVDTFDLYVGGHYTDAPATFNSTGGGGNATFSGAQYQMEEGAIQTQWEPLNQFLRKKVISKWTLPGPLLQNANRYDEHLGDVTGTRQLVQASGQLGTASASGQTHYEATTYGNPVLWKVEESWNPGAFPVKVANVFDEQRGAVTQRRQLTTNLSSTGSFVATSSGVTEISYLPHNEFLRFQTTETWSLGRVFVRFDVDDETFAPVTITTTTIATADAGQVPGLNAPGTQANYVATNEHYGRKILMTIAGPPSRREVHLSSYTYLAMVFGGSLKKYTTTKDVDKFTLNLNYRAAQTVVLPHYVDVSYGTEATLTAPVPFTFQTTTLRYDGLFFNVHAANVLTDGGMVRAQTTEDNPEWGEQIEDFSWGATFPSASQYAAMQGVNLPTVTSFALKPWKYNLWRLETVSVSL